MGLPHSTPLLSVDDYLAFERADETRHEYLDGLIYAVAGETLEHSTISANLIGIVHGQLRGRSCRALSPNMKVLSGRYFPGQTCAARLNSRENTRDCSSLGAGCRGRGLGLHAPRWCPACPGACQV